MKTSLVPGVLAALLFATVAQAHPGHVQPTGGHSHWLEFAAIALGALAVAFFVLRRVRRNRDGSSR